MANQIEPMIKLDPSGQAPILSYNVPEPSRYSGHTLFELKLPRKPSDYFKQKYFGSTKRSPQIVRYSLIGAGRNFDPTSNRRKGSTSSSGISFGGNIDFERDVYSRNLIKSMISNTEMQFLDELIRKGSIKEIPFKNFAGNDDARYIPSSTTLRPRLIIIEYYKLSTFLGSYGAGKTLNTFSLLPGEKSIISVKTYKNSESTSSKSSTIFDSYNQASADDFEQTVASENSVGTQDKSNFEYHVEAEASCNFGIASGKVSGGVAGGNNSQREEMSKNVMNATSKHASKASSQRDVNINTTSQSSINVGEETSIVREIENINVGRTLNFVFRQMNQEFISILHLTDIRIGFTNGEEQIEYRLSEIDNLIDEIIINDPATQIEIKNILLNQLMHIKDFSDSYPTCYDADGNIINNGKFIEEKDIFDVQGQTIPNKKYIRFARDRYSLYKDLNNKFLVPGIIMAVERNTIRTDGVIVDAILGQGEALDKYSQGLQDETIKEKQLSNSLKETEIDKQKLAQSIVTAEDLNKVKLFEQVYPCCPEKEIVEVSKNSN